MSSAAEQSRDARLVEIPTLGPDALGRLRRSTVAQVGAGTLGGFVIPHLAMLGVGLWLVDRDRVEDVNLGTQAFGVDSVGRPKAEVRARQALALNPACRVRASCARLEDLGLAALSDCDLIVGGLDSRGSRLRLNEISRRLGKPWVDAALDGSGKRLFGTVTLYDPRAADAACMGCRYDEAALSAIAREGRGSGCPSWREDGTSVAAPTLQVSALAAVVAGWQSLLVVRTLLGQGGASGSYQLLIDCDRALVRTVRLERSAHCLLHADRFDLLPAPEPTVGGLLERARADLGGVPERLHFHHRALALGLRCASCGAARERVRLTTAFRDDEVRCDCRPGAEMEPVELETSLKAPQLDGLRGLRWSELGFPPEDVVTATGAGRELHYVLEGVLS
jgi:molybdopterin/thiamine biosynthesis adenylyltransferase